QGSLDLTGEAHVKRLEKALARGKVLVAYLCVGDPSAEESVELARACVKAGADVLELGVPFSDPTADGPAIARASQRAIARGGGLFAALCGGAEDPSGPGGPET